MKTVSLLKSMNEGRKLWISELKKHRAVNQSDIFVLLRSLNKYKNSGMLPKCTPPIKKCPWLFTTIVQKEKKTTIIINEVRLRLNE